MLTERHIILIGYRCTGKTSIGRRLAQRLSLPFIDTDMLIEEISGESIKELVEKRGWDAFRQKERGTIKKLLESREKSVIATGGGAVLDERNAADLKKKGVLIWLFADERIIHERMMADAASAGRRPPLSTQGLYKEIQKTLAKRTPIYSSLADYSLDTGKSDLEDLVDKAIKFLTSDAGCISYNDFSA